MSSMKLEAKENLDIPHTQKSNEKRLEKMREGMIDSQIKLIKFLWIHPILHGWEMVPFHLFFFFRKLLEDVLTKIGDKPEKRKADF